ncbi:MAG: methyl-accepting chemotaxis protein [Opitutales bacterium]
MKVGTKVIAVTVGAIFLTGIVSVLVQRQVIIAQGEKEAHKHFVAIMDQAHSVIDEFSHLNQEGAFRTEELTAEAAEADDYTQTLMYETIPVVASWEAVKNVAKKEGYNFHVVRENPRNPEHAPNAEESEILQKFKAGEDDYFHVDHDKGEITFASAVHLSRDCLACHGDPANSPTGDGKDILGFPMEDWRTGDLAGAFVLKSSTDGLNATVASSVMKTLAFIVPVALVFAVAAFFLVRFSIIRPLLGTIGELDRISDEAEAAAVEISGASQSMAEGASEQAASLEETSASLEELSSQTKQNAESSERARHLVEDAMSAAETGNEGMSNMLKAMDDIKHSSHEISHIIKTIDEIAFQTNILALNAAVEAARACEAGAGFSVVAEEVRSLAQRSANAASDTARLIEESVNKSENGANICGEVSENLSDIVGRIQEIATVARDVDSSSSEQATGIGQLNTAVFEMDKVTQANAAFSEETASAAAQFTTQAEVLRRNVKMLIGLIGDFGNNEDNGDDKREIPSLIANDAHQKAISSIQSPSLNSGSSDSDHSDFFGSKEPSVKKNASESKKIPVSTVDEEEWDDFR